jgi:hypothetical protein
VQLTVSIQTLKVDATISGALQSWRAKPLAATSVFGHHCLCTTSRTPFDPSLKYWIRIGHAERILLSKGSVSYLFVLSEPGDAQSGGGYAYDNLGCEVTPPRCLGCRFTRLPVSVIVLRGSNDHLLFGGANTATAV